MVRILARPVSTAVFHLRRKSGYQPAPKVRAIMSSPSQDVFEMGPATLRYVSPLCKPLRPAEDSIVAA